MDGQVSQVMEQIVTQLIQIAIPVATGLAVLRLAAAAFKCLAGDSDEIGNAWRHIALALFVLLTARTFVHFVEGFAQNISVALTW